MSATPDPDLDFEDDDILGANLQPGEDDIELEIEDDTPPEDRGRPVAVAATPDDEEEDVDMAKYSADVQQRMRKLTAKRHDERRAKEVALREKDIALTDAQRSRQRIAQLESQLLQASSATIAATKAQAETDLGTLKAQLKEAGELGDGAAIADLTQKLVDAQLRLGAANRAEIDIKTRPAPQTPQQQQQIVRPPESEKQRSWAEKNKWFGEKDDMTALALGVHQRLIREGVEPESDLYYNRINSEMRKRFPEEFKSSNNSRTDNAAPVAGVTRSTPGAGGKMRVRLTASELSIANQLGVDPKKYAREKARYEADNG